MPVDEQGQPLIKKIGTIDIDMVETSPVVFNGRLYRFEYVRERYWANKMGHSYFRFVDHETDRTTSPFAKGYHLGSAFVDGDTVYVTAVKTWNASRIDMFISKDFKKFQNQMVLERPGVGIFNTSICESDDYYVLMYEIVKSPNLAGKLFIAMFATSKDLRTWQLLPNQCNYTFA